jgi:hypothetical protein
MSLDRYEVALYVAGAWLLILLVLTFLKLLRWA